MFISTAIYADTGIRVGASILRSGIQNSTGNQYLYSQAWGFDLAYQLNSDVHLGLEYQSANQQINNPASRQSFLMGFAFNLYENSLLNAETGIGVGHHRFGLNGASENALGFHFGVAVSAKVIEGFMLGLTGRLHYLDEGAFASSFQSYGIRASYQLNL